MLDYFYFYLLPLAIKIGMTPEQFWDDDPEYFWNYWDAYEMRKKEEAKEANIKAFNQGQYFVLALNHCLQFSKHPKQIYPKKPLSLASDRRVKMTQEQYEDMRSVQIRRIAERFNSQK